MNPLDEGAKKKVYIHQFGGWWSATLAGLKAIAKAAASGGYDLDETPGVKSLRSRPKGVYKPFGQKYPMSNSNDVRVINPLDWDASDWNAQVGDIESWLKESLSEDLLTEARRVYYVKYKGKGKGEMASGVQGSITVKTLDGKEPPKSDAVERAAFLALKGEPPGMYELSMTVGGHGKYVATVTKKTATTEAKLKKKLLGRKGHSTVKTDQPGAYGVMQKVYSLQHSVTNRAQEKARLYKWLTGGDLPESISEGAIGDAVQQVIDLLATKGKAAIVRAAEMISDLRREVVGAYLKVKFGDVLKALKKRDLNAATAQLGVLTNESLDEAKSKTAYKCKKCGWWGQLPKSTDERCPKCGSEWVSKSLTPHGKINGPKVEKQGDKFIVVVYTPGAPGVAGPTPWYLTLRGDDFHVSFTGIEMAATKFPTPKDAKVYAKKAKSVLKTHHIMKKYMPGGSNYAESVDELTTSGVVPDISGGSVMGSNRPMNTGPGVSCPICGKKCKKGVCPEHGKVYEAVLAKDVRARGVVYKKGTKVKPLMKLSSGKYNVMLAPGITTIVNKGELVVERALREEPHLEECHKCGHSWMHTHPNISTCYVLRCPECNEALGNVAMGFDDLPDGHPGVPGVDAPPNESKKEVTAADVVKIDKVDMAKVNKKFPSYAHKEDLSHGRGQGKRMGKMVMGGMATIGLSVTIRDYAKQFKVAGKDLAEIKSMSSDNDGQMLLIHYAKARYAGYSHGQAAAYAWMKQDHESPDEIAGIMNRNESLDEAEAKDLLKKVKALNLMPVVQDAILLLVKIKFGQGDLAKHRAGVSAQYEVMTSKAQKQYIDAAKKLGLKAFVGHSESLDEARYRAGKDNGEHVVMLMATNETYYWTGSKWTTKRAQAKVYPDMRSAVKAMQVAKVQGKAQQVAESFQSAYPYKFVEQRGQERYYAFDNKAGTDIGVSYGPVPRLGGTKLFEPYPAINVAFSAGDDEGWGEPLQNSGDARKVVSTVAYILRDYLRELYKKYPDANPFIMGASAMGNSKRDRIYKRAYEWLAKQFPQKDLEVVRAEGGYALRSTDSEVDYD